MPATADSHGLKRVMHEFECPLAASWQAPRKAQGLEILKKAAVSVKVAFEVPIYSNAEAVPKGARLYMEKAA